MRHQTARGMTILLGLILASPAMAQDVRRDDATSLEQSPQLPETPPGQTATSSVGQTGQRQTREQVAQEAGIEPMARIGGRIQSRAETRIRNRIDRNYAPQPSAASPFIVSGEQARVPAGIPR